jgi:hypothetical protein
MGRGWDGVAVASSIVGMGEELLWEFRSVLANSFLQLDIIDRWVCRYNPDGGYSVRGV